MKNFRWDNSANANETVNNEDEVHVWINGQSNATIRGTTGRLVVSLVDGQSTLDCSGLRAGSIDFTDKIDGQSYVQLQSAGRITFQRKIDGQSTLRYAAGGPVTGPEVNGQSRIYWRGQAPNFTQVLGETQIAQW